MDGLKSYLTDPSLSIVESTVKQLKEELDYDSAAIHQLQFAIYLYQVSSKFINNNFIISLIFYRNLLMKYSGFTP